MAIVSISSSLSFPLTIVVAKIAKMAISMMTISMVTISVVPIAKSVMAVVSIIGIRRGFSISISLRLSLSFSLAIIMTMMTISMVSIANMSVSVMAVSMMQTVAVISVVGIRRSLGFSLSVDCSHQAEEYGHYELHCLDVSKLEDPAGLPM